MYAVVDLQGHQYIVSEGAEIVVDNLGVTQSEKFVADKVLVAFSQDGKDVKVGKSEMVKLLRFCLQVNIL